MLRFPVRALPILSLLLAGAATAAAAAPPPPPPPPPARGWVLLDATSGRILAGQNDTEKLEPASLTKLLTSYVVFHALKQGKLSLEEETRVSEHAGRVGGAPAAGSTSYLPRHSNVKVIDAIKGMVLQSGNDAT